jgi:cytochrome P450
MSNAPAYNIDVKAFWHNPYPDLAAMRSGAPIAYVPQLDATLITRRNDIAVNEKRIDVFSSVQPEGLMTVLMGQNMMRKDGEDHMRERKAITPSMSQKTVRTVWVDEFKAQAAGILDKLARKREADLFWEYAMPVSADALRSMTGLTNMTAEEMNRVSQGMIDGCANYGGDPEVEARCHECTASIDRHIDEMMPLLVASPNYSLLSVMPRRDCRHHLGAADPSRPVAATTQRGHTLAAGLRGIRALGITDRHVTATGGAGARVRGGTLRSRGPSVFHVRIRQSR